MNRDYYAGMTEGRKKERTRILKMLNDELGRRLVLQLGMDATQNDAFITQGISLAFKLINGELSCLAHSEGKFDAGCTCEKGIANRVEKV